MSVRRMEFDVFGRRVQICREGNRWAAYYPGADGTRRPATDLMLPPDLEAADVERYLDDLCHEWAAPGRARVVRLD